ncbi:MAG TPA: DUF480 domain-containing protein [Pirellulales bacterium]|nr:DUF480 domain-containing protein [Pirellulales bacterium]
MSLSTDAEKPQPRWQPLPAIDRRVLGVLAEKAKTTPDAYPMSINGICTGANQKNNRYPLMQLEPDDAEESLDRLRNLGAVAVIQGSGRVSKYRHYLYEWLGVDKVELAVMAELLLRGTQTEGELRGRAARMEPIADLAALRPVLESLKAKGLVIPLTPEGRGHVVTHALYEPRELEKQKAEFAGAGVDSPPVIAAPTAAPKPAPPAAAPSSAAPPPPTEDSSSAVRDLRRETAALREELSELRKIVEDLGSELRARSDDFDRLKEALGA